MDEYIYVFEFDSGVLFGATEDISAQLHALETSCGARAKRAFYMTAQGALKKSVLHRLESCSRRSGRLLCNFDRAKQLMTAGIFPDT